MTAPLFSDQGTGRLAPPPEAPPAPSPFASPGFGRVWLAHSASQLGDRIHHLALMWWTLDTTGSLALSGAMLMATSVPAVLLGPAAGTVADRVDRKALMVGCDLARAAIVAVVAALALDGRLTVEIALVASALLAAVGTFFTPAAMALVPGLVPPAAVQRGTATMEASVQGATVLGPALGGVVVAAFGAGGAFGLNGLSFILSAAFLIGVAFPARAVGGAAEGFFEAMGGGFRLLGRLPAVAGVLTCFALVNVFTMPVLLFMPYFAKTVFHAGAAGLGWLEAALGLGMLAAALFWSARAGGVKRFPVVAGGIAGVGAAVVMMGAWPLFPVHLAALALAGACMGSVNVVVVAWFQSQVPAAELGRFFGLLTSVCSGLIPLSFGAYGLLAGTVDPAVLLLGNGVVIALLAIALALVPGFRRA